jgi:hypothetical protein
MNIPVHQFYDLIYFNVRIFVIEIVVITPLPEGGGGYTVLSLSVLPSVQDIFRRIFLSNC